MTAVVFGESPKRFVLETLVYTQRHAHLLKIIVKSSPMSYNITGEHRIHETYYPCDGCASPFLCGSPVEEL